MKEPCLSESFSDIRFLTVYKFTHSKYLDDFLSGRSIKFGTIDEFRGEDAPGLPNRSSLLPFEDLPKRKSIKEQIYERMGIAVENSPVAQTKTFVPLSSAYGIDDPFENRNVFRDSRADAMALSALGLNPSNPGISASMNTYIAEGANYPIFCCTDNIHKDTISRLQRDSLRFSGSAYDAVIPIVNVPKFGECLDEAWSEFYKHRSLSHSVLVGPVEYRDKHNVSSVSINAAPNPFEKDRYFRSQAEIRFLYRRPAPDRSKGTIMCLPSRVARYLGNPIAI